MNEFGERLELLLDMNKINRTKLASLIGVSGPMISKYISGKSEPTKSVLEQMALHLNTTTDFLIMGHSKVTDELEERLLDAYHKLDIEYQSDVVLFAMNKVNEQTLKKTR